MVLKNKGFVAGAAVGVMLTGAAVAGVTAGFNGGQPRISFAGDDQPQLIRTQNVTPALARPPAGAPLSFADIVERVSPAVVSLEVRGRGPGRNIRIPGFENFPFDLVPRNPDGRPGDNDGDNVPETQASGSGFFISPDGYIVTNNHVVENATEINVVLSDDRELPARVVGRDENTDLAVLKVEGRNFPYVSFASNAQPRVGDWVIAVGNPFQLGNTATAGIVSARGRDIGEAFVDYLQIDAPINRGNSGGPTFDIQGRVVGVNTAIFSTTGGSQGIGFAIPADIADQITRQLISGGRVTRGYLGVSLQPEFSNDAAACLGLANNDGALVNDVTPGGPAARAGLQRGDVILRVNGRPIENSSDLTRRVAAVRAGETLRLDVWRDGRVRTFTATSGTRPPEQELQAQNGGGANERSTPDSPAQVNGSPVLGMSLSNVDASSRSRYNLNSSVRGVVVERVESGSNAARLGLRRGDVITRVNTQDVSGVAEVQAVVEAARRANRPAVLLWVSRNGSPPTAVPLRIQPRAAG
ncbi:MAG: Do family serine endopeptidase [Pseudomonadota bacterium]|nr:Do family serine endopeptidase [Pseudomonadota bacterium]